MITLDQAPSGGLCHDIAPTGSIHSHMCCSDNMCLSVCCPPGLPGPTVNLWFPINDISQMLPLAMVIMLVDLLESTSIARALAAKGGYELHANQEIVGLGLANFAGSAFNSYSTTGSFSRSAVNYDSGRC